MQNDHQILTTQHRSLENIKKPFFSGIMEGDVLQCLQMLDKSNKFEVIIADPPYNIGKDFGNNIDHMQMKDYIEWSKEWLRLCFDLLSQDGLIYVYGFPEILARIAVEYPIEKQRLLAWHYTNKTVPSSTFWQRSYEGILCLWKEDKPKLEIDQIREPYTENYLKCNGRKRSSTKGRFSDGNKDTKYKVHEKGALPRDVIKIPALAGATGLNERHFMCRTCDFNLFHAKQLKFHKNHNILQHPTQKPMQLTKKLIQSRIKVQDKLQNLYVKTEKESIDDNNIITENKILCDTMKNRTFSSTTKVNGRVLIPFAGSGSECVVAKSLNIQFVGIEMNPEYVDYANKWLKNVEKEGICID